MSRLNRGQTAIGILRKQEECRVSVQARIDLLKSLQRGDADASHFAKNFRTIQTLCEWSYPPKNIEAVSIKTFRTHVERLYTGGIRKFKEDIYELTSHAKAINPSTTKRLMENRADAVLEMVQRYQDLVEKMVRLSSSNELVQNALKSHLQKYGDYKIGKSKVIYASFRKDGGEQ